MNLSEALQGLGAAPQDKKAPKIVRLGRKVATTKPAANKV